MRILAVCSAIVVLMLGVSAIAGPPWCAAYRNGSTNCGFYTYQQCMDTIAGNGGFCNRNYIDGDPEKSTRKERKTETSKDKKAEASKRKEKEKEQAAPAVKPTSPPAAAQSRSGCAASIVSGRGPAAAAAPAQQQANAFGAARALILSGKYDAGIAAMKALGYDDHPDVASSIGFAYAKLGNLNEARAWYSKALAADPNHLATWGYSGALFVVQGDIEKARRDLDRVKALCGGTTCREYQELNALIAAKAK